MHAADLSHASLQINLANGSWAGAILSAAGVGCQFTAVTGTPTFDDATTWSGTCPDGVVTSASVTSCAGHFLP